MIQMRHHFSRAAAAGDPAEIMIGVFFGRLLSAISAPKPFAATLPAMDGRRRIAAHRRSACPAPAHAIGELHGEVAGIAEAPMIAVAFDLQAVRSIMLARRRMRPVTAPAPWSLPAGAAAAWRRRRSYAPPNPSPPRSAAALGGAWLGVHAGGDNAWGLGVDRSACGLASAG